MANIPRNRLDTIEGLTLLKRGEVTIRRIADRMGIPYNRLWQRLKRSGMQPDAARALADELESMGGSFFAAAAELRVLAHAYGEGKPLPTPTKSTSPDAQASSA